jgi:competence protein ComEA
VDRYTRRQLVLLLVVVLVAAAGIAVDRWRRTHAELADRLEAFDRTPAAPAAAPPGASATPRPTVATPRAPRPARGPTPPLDLNAATVDELDGLPGVGHGLASRIVDSRTRNGPFSAVEELRRVRGVGRVTLERLRPLLIVTRPP